MFLCPDPRGSGELLEEVGNSSDSEDERFEVMMAYRGEEAKAVCLASSGKFFSEHFDGIMSTLYQPGFLGEFVAVLQAAPFPGPQAIQTPKPKSKARAAAEHVPRRPDTWKPLPFIIDEVDDIFDEFRGSMGGLGACDHLNSLLVPVKQLLMEGSVTKDHRHGRVAQFFIVHDPEGLYEWIEDQLQYVIEDYYLS